MKKNIYPIILLIGLSICVLPVNSQTKKTTDGPSKQVKPDNAKEFKNRQLLVAATGDIIFDEKVMFIMSKYWSIHENIEFVTYDQLDTKISESPDKYGVLTINHVKLSEVSDIGTRQNRYLRFSIWFGERMNKKRALYYQNILYNNVPVEEITKRRIFSKNKNVYNFDLDNTEILFAIGVIQNHINARIEGKPRSSIFYEAVENANKLQNKTLLIAESDLDEKLKGETLDDFYPYPHKITTIKEIEEKFMAQDKNYAYVEIVPFGYAVGINSLYVVDCENGELLSFGEEHNGVFDDYSNYVSKKHLRKFVSNSNRGNKNK